MDNTITSKLLEAGFDDQADLEPFYKGFKANIAKYEAENSDVVETLYTFIDFSKFKENILDIKKAIDFKGTGNDNTNRAGFNIHTAEDFWKLAKEDIDDPALGWKQMLEYKMKDGIAFKLWTRPMEGTHLHLSQSRSTIENCTVKQIYNYMHDLENFKKAPMLDKLDVIENTETSRIAYVVMKMPLMTNRDAIFST